MELVNIALRLFTVSQLILFALLIVSSKNPLRVRLVTVLLMVSLINYLLMPLVENLPVFRDYCFFWYPSNIAPSLLLLMVWFIFEEDCTVPAWLVGVVSFGVVTSFWFHFNGVGLPESPLWLQASKVIIAIIAAIVVWVGRDNDLVELRAKARYLFVFLLSLIMSLVLMINIFAGFSTSNAVDFIELSIHFLFSVIGNYMFIKYNPQYQLMADHTQIKEESDDPVITELLQKMRDERLYADHDLRLGGLASLLRIPEYKLRAKINQQLGYRNFNHFINRYRIEEAGVKLRENERMPVLSIALDVGFRSISSFNSAFQSQFGVSPTKYRAEMLLDTMSELPKN